MFNKIKKNTYEKILRAAQDLIIKNPYHTVSLSMIAKKAGVTKAALYYYFRNKEELFLEIFKKMAESFKEELNKNIKEELPPQENLKNFIVTYINFFFIKKNLIQILIQKVSKSNKKICSRLKGTREDIISKLEKIMDKILKDDKRKEEVSSRMAAMMILGMLGTFFIKHAYDKKTEISPEKIANKIINFLNFK